MKNILIITLAILTLASCEKYDGTNPDPLTDPHSEFIRERNTEAVQVWTDSTETALSLRVHNPDTTLFFWIGYRSNSKVFDLGFNIQKQAYLEIVCSYHDTIFDRTKSVHIQWEHIVD